MINKLILQNWKQAKLSIRKNQKSTIAHHRTRKTANVSNITIKHTAFLS